MRVVADHLRAMTFLIADGVVPSNEWRGYVLRKIMRRAMRHGKKLGLTEPFLHTLVGVVVREMGGAYPELRTGQNAIVSRPSWPRKTASTPSSRPGCRGSRTCSTARRRRGRGVVAGDELFRLYDSLGVPLDFAEDLAGQRGLTIDRAGYEAAMEGQRERARAGSKFEAGRAAPAGDRQCARTSAAPDVFTGYDATEVDAKVLDVSRPPRTAR